MENLKLRINKLLAPILLKLNLDRKLFHYFERKKLASFQEQKKQLELAEQLERINDVDLFKAQLVQVLESENQNNYKLPLFCCLRNEMHRIPFFLNYYRKLGVDQFFFIDNNSNDGFQDYLATQNDCSVWYTAASYKDSKFGMEWCNILLKEFGVGKWCLTVDPDEFIIYPMCETRNLYELIDHMNQNDQKSLFTVMVDCYSKGDIQDVQIDSQTSPFDVCRYFDRYNFIQTPSEHWNNYWIQGGVRMRKYFKENPKAAPALNKVPLIKWEEDMCYISSMHHTNKLEYNCTIKDNHSFISGCLLHFKYVNKLEEKVREEMQRNEHYDNSAEYKRYYEDGIENMYDPNWSVKYKNSQQLLDLKFMHRGNWF